jgi:hypothetical protein
VLERDLDRRHDVRGCRLIAGGVAWRAVAKLTACRSAIDGGARVFVADGKDLAGLAVLARHGRAAGAGKSTRITKGTSASRRQINKRAS